MLETILHKFLPELIVVVSPFVIMAITNKIKQAQSIQVSENKKKVLRYVVGLFSFGAAALASIVSGEPLNTEVVSTFVDATLVFLGATGAYFFDKIKNKVG